MAPLPGHVVSRQGGPETLKAWIIGVWVLLLPILVWGMVWAAHRQLACAHSSACIAAIVRQVAP